VKTIRTYLSRFILLVVALQILNLSVYSGDIDVLAASNNQKTIGEYNQIDFLIEYVAEIMLDHKDAFPENGVHNHNNFSHQMKHICIKIINFKKVPDISSHLIASALPTNLKEDYKYLFSSKIIPPPPKA
jgi:hypothetical protein